MERFLIDDGIKQLKIVANRYKWSIENADMGSEDANELNADIRNQYVKEYEQIAEWLEELKSYKEAEKTGLFLRLPVPIGKIVYCIYAGMTGKNATIFADYFNVDMCKSWGKFVFATKEEAEKKLKEIKNNA